MIYKGDELREEIDLETERGGGRRERAREREKRVIKYIIIGLQFDEQ